MAQKHGGTVMYVQAVKKEKWPPAVSITGKCMPSMAGMELRALVRCGVLNTRTCRDGS
jgi:hypothetical protein